MHSLPVLTEITLHKKSRTLEVMFSTGESFVLPFEYLRVFSRMSLTAISAKSRMIDSTSRPTQPTTAKTVKKAPVVVAHDNGPPPIHFNFYSELPSMQMTSRAPTVHAEKAVKTIADEKPKDSRRDPEDISKLLTVEKQSQPDEKKASKSKL